jgi:hypothetical protein
MFIDRLFKPYDLIRSEKILSGKQSGTDVFSDMGYEMDQEVKHKVKTLPRLGWLFTSMVPCMDSA